MQITLKEQKTYEKIKIIIDLITDIETEHPELNISFNNIKANNYELRIENLTCHFTTYSDVIAALNLVGITANIVEINHE